MNSRSTPAPSASHPIDPQRLAFAEGMRSAYRAAMPMAGTPDPVAEIRSLRIDASAPRREIALRVYVPLGARGAGKLPVVLFVHGGGFVSGDLETHDVVARAIANGAQALVAAVDYRLAPEFPYPAGLDDVDAALRWLAGHAAQIGGDTRALAVCGDSAGANLATAAVLLARDRGGPAIRAQWLMYATLGHRRDTGSWQQFGATNFPTLTDMAGISACYVPAGVEPSSPLLAPLEADPRGLPPTLVQVGECDPLRDENVAYAAALQRAGVQAEARVYPGQQHGFVQFYKDKEHNALGEAALVEGIAFLRSRLGVNDLLSNHS